MLEYISAPEAAKKWGIFRKTGTETLREKPHTVVAKFSQLIIDININASQPMVEHPRFNYWFV